MIGFYSGVIFICILSLISLAIDAGKNTTLSYTDIKWFRFTFLLVAFGALCEWAGVIFNEVFTVPNWIHYIVTLLEFCISPFSAVFLTRSCGIKRHVKLMLLLMGIHVLVELALIPFGLIFYIDEAGICQSGALYNIYMVFCFISLAYVIVVFASIGKKMGLNASITLIIIIIIILIGQFSYIVDEKNYAGYISVSIAAFILYNYFQVYLRHQMINTISQEKDISNHDSLTGVLSRIYFDRRTKEINQQIKNTPRDLKFAIAECDLNNLKYINDAFGHDVGDEYIKRCCKFICNYFKHSQIFRIGGDEFVILIQDEDYQNVDSIIQGLRDFSTDEAKKDLDFSSRTSFAIGYSLFDFTKDKNVSQILRRADLDMYKNKKEIKSIMFSH